MVRSFHHGAGLSGTLSNTLRNDALFCVEQAPYPQYLVVVTLEVLMVMLDVPLVERIAKAAEPRYSDSNAIIMPAWKVRRQGRVAPKPLSAADFETAEAFGELMLEKLERTGV